MNSKKPLIPARLLLPIGLLLVALPMLINDFIKVPDFLRGLFMGIGIVLEIAGFVKLKKTQNANKSPQANS